MRLINYYLLLISCYFLMLTNVRSEVYTALIDMVELLDTEAVLINTLNVYINEQEQRLDQLKVKAKEFKKEHDIASKDSNEYLANPINAYLLTKRLTSDWKQVEELITELSYEVERNISDYKKILKFPTEEDLTGAAFGLMRLQDTYDMDTSSLARGELNGVKYSTQLSASDCFELGRQSYNNQDFYHTVLWMREALNRYSKNNTDMAKWEILEYLAYSTYMEGNLNRAVELTDELLELNPNHQRALGNKAYYTKELDKKKENNSNITKPDENAAVNRRNFHDYLPERELYEMTCRGEVKPDISIMSQLKCRYVHHNNPFLRIAPLKEEEAYPKPRIVLYRQALYDDEIEIIKKMAQPRLKRATVQNYKSGELEAVHYRISKSAWLKEDEDSVVAKVSQRVEDMSQLTTETAEELQVVNYGIGGHYEPHFDFARREEKNAFQSLGTGNRIATVLFYMSDVTQGGATVFPSLHLALWPEKGTAAFWHNLHPDSEGDVDTRHAACPVLAGTKWVCNKWLHERGQELLRPCTLQPSININDHF